MFPSYIFMEYYLGTATALPLNPCTSIVGSLLICVLKCFKCWLI